MKLTFLSITIICLSEACLSDSSEGEETVRDQEFWYHPTQEALYYYIYVAADYYISVRGVFRLLTTLALGYRNYYEFYLHRRTGDRLDIGLVLFAFAFIPINLIYDISEDSKTPSDINMNEIKTAKTMGLSSLELELAGLSESSALYNISKQLRNLGINKIVFTYSQIDNVMHLLGELTQVENNDKIFFDIRFSTLDSGNYYWVELCCNANVDCNTSSAIPLSVLSEEVLNKLAFPLNESNFSLDSTSDFEVVKGVDFSVNENFIVVKIQRRKANTDAAAYSICDTQTHTLQLKNNHLKFSNQTLVSEIKRRLSVKPEGWFPYIIKLFVKQFEHIAFLWITDSFFERIFLGECGICREAMTSGAITLASCYRHNFCTSCLKQWAQHGSGKCPYCQ